MMGHYNQLQQSVDYTSKVEEEDEETRVASLSSLFLLHQDILFVSNMTYTATSWLQQRTNFNHAAGSSLSRRLFSSFPCRKTSRGKYKMAIKKTDPLKLVSIKLCDAHT